MHSRHICSVGLVEATFSQYSRSVSPHCSITQAWTSNNNVNETGHSRLSSLYPHPLLPSPLGQWSTGRLADRQKVETIKRKKLAKCACRVSVGGFAKPPILRGPPVFKDVLVFVKAPGLFPRSNVSQ